jgi:hypothetical protein
MSVAACPGRVGGETSAGHSMVWSCGCVEKATCGKVGGACHLCNINKSRASKVLRPRCIVGNGAPKQSQNASLYRILAARHTTRLASAHPRPLTRRHPAPSRTRQRTITTPLRNRVLAWELLATCATEARLVWGRGGCVLTLPRSADEKVFRVGGQSVPKRTNGAQCRPFRGCAHVRTRCVKKCVQQIRSPAEPSLSAHTQCARTN